MAGGQEIFGLRYGRLTKTTRGNFLISPAFLEPLFGFLTLLDLLAELANKICGSDPKNRTQKFLNF